MRFLQDVQYPRCDAYLGATIALLDRQYSRVWRAFYQVCESETLARQAISYGRDPLVHVGGVPDGKNGRYRGRSGGPRHTVFIHPRVALAYEEDNDRLLWESTVLHEMVHWARFIGGKSRLYEGREAGVAFETLAYGYDID
jgi:hypothetical protein